MNRKLMLAAIALCTLLAQPAMAQSDLGFKRAGISVSMVSPENVDATFGLGAFADLGTIAPNWALESRLDWWSHSESVFGADASLSDITLGARSVYLFPTSSTVQPFAGFGLGMHFLSAEVAVVDPFTSTAYTVKDSETRLGVDFGGGIKTPINPSTMFHAEGWYGIVSDFNQFSLRAGISRAFGN